MPTPTTPAKGSGLRGADTAAQARIQALAREKKALETKVAELTDQLAAAGDLPGLQQQLANMKAERKADSDRWAQERALITAGITDAEGVDVALFAYNRLPAEGRPELAAWLADDAALPKAVAAYKPAAVAPPEPAAGQPHVATPAAAAPPVAALGAPRLPARSPAAAPPPASKLTAQLVNQTLTSAAYKALPPAEKRAKLAELQAQAAAAPGAI